jgi:hypothetical protein
MDSEALESLPVVQRVTTRRPRGKGRHRRILISARIFTPPLGGDPAKIASPSGRAPVVRLTIFQPGLTPNPLMAGLGAARLRRELAEQADKQWRAEPIRFQNFLSPAINLCNDNVRGAIRDADLPLSRAVPVRRTPSDGDRSTICRSGAADNFRTRHGPYSPHPGGVSSGTCSSVGARITQSCIRIPTSGAQSPDPAQDSQASD